MGIVFMPPAKPDRTGGQIPDENIHPFTNVRPALQAPFSGMDGYSFE